MGLITAGLMISARKSIGGVNLYKRNGQQCIRNKPQRSPDYVSTDAQVRQQSSFGLVSAFAKSSAFMAWLISNAFTMKPSGKGSTNHNVFTAEVLRATTRDFDGQPYMVTDRDEAREALATDAIGFFASRCALTKSSLSVTIGTYVAGTASDPGTVVFQDADIAAARAEIVALNGDYNNGLNPSLLVMAGDGADASVIDPQLVTGTGTAGGPLTFTLPETTPAGTILQFALVFYPGTAAPTTPLTKAAVTQRLEIVL